MSIVKGTSGELRVSANLIPSWDYTIAVWYKVAASSFGYVLDFVNDSATPSQIFLYDNSFAGFLRHRLVLATTNRSANTSASAPANTWVPAVMRSTDVDKFVKLDALGESAVSPTAHTDPWIPPSDPELLVFRSAAGIDPITNGAKVGMIAIYSHINDADTAFLIGGGNPMALPSATSPTELWIDTEGVVESGGNLTTWTGTIASTVLTPSGTVTVDNADLAPITAAGPAITPSDPVVDGAQATITTSGLSGAITATLGGYSITTAGTLPNLTYTLDIASITATGPVSVPRIGDSLELSVTGTEGTATSTVSTQAAAGMAVVTLAGTLATETDGLIDKMQEASGLTVAVPNIIMYPTANNTDITPAGELTTDATSLDILLIQGGSATVAGSGYAFTVIPEAESGSTTNTLIKKVRGIKMKAGPVSSAKVSARKLSG